MALERLREIFIGIGKPKELRNPPIKPKPSPAGVESSRAATTKTATPEKPPGTIRIKNPPEAGPKMHASEAQLTRKELQAKLDTRAANQPVSKKLEILLEEVPDINPAIAKEVQTLAATLREAPNPNQWVSIQESLGRISQFSDVQVVEVAKMVRGEVQQYTFSQVLAHAKEYGLTRADAPRVAQTFREATVVRHRELMRQDPGLAPQSDVQQAIEKAFVDEELARNMRAAQGASKISSERDEEDEQKTREEEAKRQREVKNHLASDAERIKQFTTIEEVGAYINETILEIADPSMRDFLQRNPIQSRAVLEFLHQRFSEGKNLMQAARDLSLTYMSPHQPFSPAQSAEIRRLFAQLEIAAGPLGLAEIKGGSGAPYQSPTPEWWAIQTGGHKASLYGATPAERLAGQGALVTIPEIHSWLLNAQSRIDAAGNIKGALDRELMGILDHEFNIILDGLSKQKPPIAIPDYVYQYKTAINENFRELIKMEQSHMDLGLSGDSKEVVWRMGPEAALLSKVREVEQFSKSYEGDTFRAASAMKKLEQMQAYISDPLFINEWRRYKLMQPGHQSVDIINGEIESFINGGIDTLSNTIDWRRNLVKLYNAYSAQGLTEEKISQLLSPFGSEGYLGTLGFYEGRVASAYDYFDAVLLSSHRDSSTDDIIWLSTDTIKDIYKTAVDDMKAGAVADLNGLQPWEIEEIAFLAQEAHFISGRTVLAMNRGLGPLEQPGYAAGTRYDKQHGFGAGGGSNIERAASARKPLRFGFYRWSLDNEGIRVNLDSDALFAAGGNHVEGVVDDIIAEATRRGRLEDVVRYTCDLSAKDIDPANPSRADLIKGRLKATFIGFDAKGNVRTPPTTLAEAAANIPVLKERLMSKIGMQIVESSVMDYTMLDSGPMVHATLNKLGEKFTYADQLAISMQVRDAYANVLGAQNHHDRQENIHTLEGVLRKAARYNPTDLLNGHLDTRNFTVEDWYAGLNMQDVNNLLRTPGDVQCTGDLIKVVTKIDANIESLIKRQVRAGTHLKRIDWTQALSDGHKDAVRASLRAAKRLPAGANVEAELESFIRLKRSMAEFVGSPNMIRDATKMDFMVKYGYQTNNSSDCWLDLVEDPRFGDKTGTFKKLSETIGRRGSGDLLVRAHFDTETALKAKDALFQAIQTLDWKTYIKAFTEIRWLTRNVYGKPWDGRSFMYYTAGFLEARSQDLLSEISFEISRMIRPKDSKLRRVLNSEHAPSDPIEKRYEYVGEMENTIGQSLEAVDHELAEYFSEYVHLNFGPDLHVVQNDILWAKRIYRVVAFGSMLLAIGYIKEGTDELNVGGGGGGGGGQHH